MGFRNDILLKEIIGKAKKYIKKNSHHRELSLEEVADKVSLNYYYFSHMFRKYCKMSFIDYLTKVRLQRAVKLLKNPRLTVAQIAFAVGYRDRGYLAKVFRKVYKTSPTEFREEFFKRKLQSTN